MIVLCSVILSTLCIAHIHVYTCNPCTNHAYFALLTKVFNEQFQKSYIPQITRINYHLNESLYFPFKLGLLLDLYGTLRSDHLETSLVK